MFQKTLIVLGVLFALPLNACLGPTFTVAEPGGDAGVGSPLTADGDAGTDSGTDAGVQADTQTVAPDAGPPVLCKADLSNTGTGDFRIAFTLTTTSRDVTLSLLNERSGCTASGDFWAITLSPAGGIVATTNSGNTLVTVEAGDSVNDGAPHRIVVERVSGYLSYANDGVVRSATIPDPDTFGELPNMMTGQDACDDTVPLVGRGTITDVCLSAEYMP